MEAPLLWEVWGARSPELAVPETWRRHGGGYWNVFGFEGFEFSSGAGESHSHLERLSHSGPFQVLP